MERDDRRADLVPKAASLPVYMWIAAGALVVVGYFLWSKVETRPRTGPLPALALLADDGRPLEKAWFKEGPAVMLLFLPGDARSDADARELETLRKAWEPRGVRFLGVSLAHRRDLARESAVVNALAFPIVTAQGNVLDALVVDRFPATLVIDRHARVVARTHGVDGPAALAPELERLVDAGPR